MLDVATGTGDFALMLAETLAGYDEIVGVDSRDEPLATARGRKLPPRVRFEQADAARLPWPASSFDTAAISNSLHHLVDPERALSEMRRVLRPGGRLVISEMVCDRLTPAQQTHELTHRLLAELNSAQGIPHQPTFTRAALTVLYTGLGVKDADVFEVAPDDGPARDAADVPDFFSRFSRQLESARALPGFAAWQRRAEELAERIRRVGIQPPPRLWLVGTKP